MELQWCVYCTATPPQNSAVVTSTEEELLTRCETAHVLVQKGDLPALVEEVDDGQRRMIKLWWFSKRGWRQAPHPGFARFCRASETLRTRDFIAPMITERGEVPGTPVRWVAYPKIAGDPLNQLSNAARIELLPALTRWVKRLHDAGCYCRGLHLGNVLVLPGHDLALIDVADTRFNRRPLGYAKRVRNLGSFLAHPPDNAWWKVSAGEALVRSYAEVQGLDQPKLWSDVSRQIAMRTRKRTRQRRRRGLDPLPEGEYTE